MADDEWLHLKSNLEGYTDTEGRDYVALDSLISALHDMATLMQDQEAALKHGVDTPAAALLWAAHVLQGLTDVPNKNIYGNPN